jgi:signal peptidase I
MYDDDEVLSNIEVNSIDGLRAKKILIKYLISASILLIILIISLINLSRIQMFGRVIGSFAGIFEGLGILLFYLSLGISFLYFIGMLIYVLIMHLLKNEWRDILILIDKKTDIFSFIFEVFAIILFIMIFIFTPCTVRGDSMNPTFQTGQNVICTNYMAGSPKKDDVIVFDARNENFPVDDVFYIKRVVATPGSIVKYDTENYTLYVDGIKVEIIGNDKFTRINSSIGKTDDTGSDYYEYKVPKNKYLVLGDNRDNSQDSRSFGYINKKQIFGRVTMRIFPLDKIKFY